MPTTSPYGSAVDIRPDGHSTRSVDIPPIQAEHLTSTPSRTRIPPTNDPVVRQRAETYQRTNVSTPTYEGRHTSTFQQQRRETMTMAQSRSTERQASDDHSRQYHRGTSTVNIIDCLDTVNNARCSLGLYQVTSPYL